MGGMRVRGWRGRGLRGDVGIASFGRDRKRGRRDLVWETGPMCSQEVYRKECNVIEVKEGLRGRE